MGIFSRAELESLGFLSIGKDVRISSRASFYGTQRIAIGDNVRIDDFCVLSAGAGGIRIGSHIHVAVYTSLIGREAITLDDFANLSSRVSVYSSSDDYSGHTMTNPTIPDEFKDVTHKPVSIGRHAIVGAGSVLLPGAKLSEGAAVGALSLVAGICNPFTIYAGVPARAVRLRSRNLVDLELGFLAGRGK